MFLEQETRFILLTLFYIEKDIHWLGKQNRIYKEVGNEGMNIDISLFISACKALLKMLTDISKDFFMGFAELLA